MRRGSIVQLVALGVVIGAASTVVALLVPWLPPNASEQRNGIDLVFWFTTAIALAVFTLVFSVIVYSIIKFRVRPDDDSDGPPIHGHTGVEIVWTAIPAILVTAISVMSGIVLVQNDRAGTGHLNVNVIARQFEWSFQDPASGNLTSSELYLPVHQAVELHLTSLDVIHAFWVPEFGPQEDALPGQTTKLVITPTKVGTYPVICAELCGLGHALMRSSAVVVAPAAFQSWLKAQQQALKAPPSQAGRAVYTNNGCAGCHTLRAAGSTGTTGPNLDKLPAEAQQAHQPLEAFVRQSIVAPDAYIQPGYPAHVMPSTVSSLPAPQLDALVKFLIASSKGGP